MKREWWHDKTAYQIYPKSFYDSNGDGIGDLPGIISKLDYLKELGVDILWLSPIYKSPLADQGYDIADYYSIDPRFGTLEDMDELIAQAKKRDMYILMDLVVNHCSDEHEWFQKAIADPDGEYGNFFYIEEKKDGKLPCNWRSYFGGPVWEPLPEHSDKQYLHLFHKKQPDLNWENAAVRREVYKNIQWWLDRGLGGFRIDAIINIKKKLPFRDYPADREDGLCSVQYMLKDAQGIGTFLEELAEETFRPAGAFTVGEVFDAKEDELRDFIGEKGYFSSMFDFSPTCCGKDPRGWYASEPVLTPEEYKKCIFSSQEKVKNIGMFSNIIENHDEPRGVSHYIRREELCQASKKLLAGVYFFLRGLPFIYQGQEIGMENVPFTSISQIEDVNTLDEYQVALDAGLTPGEALKAVCAFSRDNARTPMQWDDSANAGFTKGTPWLEVSPDFTKINVKAQEEDENSVLSFYKKMIRVRRDAAYKETVVYGEFVPYLEEEENLIAYFRRGERTLLLLANFQSGPREAALPGVVRQVVLNNQEEAEFTAKSIKLKGFQLVLLEIAGEN